MWMYHCGTAPALHHIGNGMFGAIIIDPPDLPAVDHEFVIVQSELYLGAEGGVGDLGKMQDEAEDAVVFNRSEEHTSELQSLMRISYAVFCLKNNKHTQ